LEAKRATALLQADGLDTSFLARGINYAITGRISIVEVIELADGETKIMGWAEGSKDNVYDCEAIVDWDYFEETIETREFDCDCPVGGGCKHSIGLLWLWLCQQGDNNQSVALPSQTKVTKVAEPETIQQARALPFRLENWLYDSNKPVPVKKPSSSRDGIGYALTQAGELKAIKIKVSEDNRCSIPRNNARVSLHWVRSAASIPSYVSPADQGICMLLDGLIYGSSAGDGWPVEGAIGAQLMRMTQATGRLWLDEQVLENASMTVGGLTWVDKVNGEFTWQNQKGKLSLHYAAPDGRTWQALATDPPMGIDRSQGEIAELATQITSHTLKRLINLPAPPLDEPLLWRFIADSLAQFPDAAHLPALPLAIEALPRPAATLVFSLAEIEMRSQYTRETRELVAPVVQLRFHYPDGRVIPYDARAAKRAIEDEVHKGKIVKTHIRNYRAEEAFLMRIPPTLRPLRYVETQLSHAYELMQFDSYWALPNHDWGKLGGVVLAEAQASGFQLDILTGFPISLDDIPEPTLELIDDKEPGWFRFSLGVDINGKRVDLAPPLARLMGAQPDPAAWLHALNDDDPILLGLDGGQVVRFKGGRIKAMLLPVLEWFQGGEVNAISGLQAKLLPEVSVWYKGRDNEAWAKLRQNLLAGASLLPVAPPADFKAELRPYQLHGLAWLAHLRELGMSGVLADDMGLGKTVQTLAHVMREKQAGAKRPCLIVAPTSVVGNWASEGRRFAPSLSFHVHQGQGRSTNVKTLKAVDVVLTSYPILQRDATLLKKIDWQIVVYDEAQVVKNAKAKTHLAAQGLSAYQSIALTGTPMENHLGELWAQFNLLIPGLLGTPEVFNNSFRRPIEINANNERMQQLRSRIRPFLLRRTRDEVLGDLPEKTEFQTFIEFESGQADVYESMRVAIHDDVRKVIRDKGLKQSTIHILDALLKLRQVCCDPRLVKLKAAREIKAESAKLQWLRENLPELIEGGHRVLLFSQFTSMLALIEVELKILGIRYVILTGDTDDRATPIEQFQKGEVPLFLLSLKAGGVGLNLTAADTVIHYDPWWNPAVEAQATARAHRIGQQKPVFVYKLIAKGTLEERMLDLLARKQQLASALLEGGGAALAGLTVADVDEMLGPIATK
jgi:superfamily II DNA or RNA helicase